MRLNDAWHMEAAPANKRGSAPNGKCRKTVLDRRPFFYSSARLAGAVRTSITELLSE
jgi:hypothetical protein